MVNILEDTGVLFDKLKARFEGENPIPNPITQRIEEALCKGSQEAYEKDLGVRHADIYITDHHQFTIQFHHGNGSTT